MHPYRDMEPTDVELGLSNQWCGHCEFRHHPRLDFVAYDGTVCYLVMRDALAALDAARSKEAK